MSGRSPLLRRWIRGLSTVALISLSTPAALAAPGEFVDRADGVAGGTALGGATPAGLWIADDGSSALLRYSVPGDAALTGIYRRDIAGNRTVQVLSAPTEWESVSADGRIIALVTAKRLVAADTDDAKDLYLVDVASKAAARVDSGATAEIRNPVIAGNGQVVVWSRGGVTYRRATSGGAPIRVGSGVPAAVTPDGAAVLLHGSAARDVRLVRGGVETALVVPSSVGNQSGWILSSDATRAAIMRDRSQGRSVFVIDTATGARRQIDYPESDYLDWIVRFDPTGRYVVGGFVFSYRSEAARNGFGLLDTVTGAIFPVGPTTQTPAPTTLSWNGAYGLQWTAQAHLIAAPLLGGTLPGGADPGSPHAFLSLSAGCRSSNPLWATRPSLTFDTKTSLATTPTSIAVTVRKTSTGALIGTYTLRPPTQTSKALTTGFGDFTLDSVATYPNGATVRDRWVVRPYDPGTCPPTFF